ncbi:MAG: SAF domain-containing protein [Desulfocucumaceae bacterium]
MSLLKKIAHILIALILASIAGGIVWYYVKINTPSEKVVVSANKLPVGTVIGAQDVIIKEYPLSVVPKKAIGSVQDVIGKTVVSGMVFPGEVILKEHIASDVGSLKAVLSSLAPGREAIDLPSETAVGLKGVTAGDLVNVFSELAVGKDITTVECVAREAVIINAPSTSDRDNSLAASAPKESFIIAVTPEEARKVAEGYVRGKRFSLTVLPPKGGQ